MLFKEKLQKVHCNFEKWRQYCVAYQLRAGMNKQSKQKCAHRMGDKTEERE